MRSKRTSALLATLHADAALRPGSFPLGKQSTHDLRATARFGSFRIYR